MSLKSRFSSVITLAFAVGAFGVVASAQTTPAPKDDSQKLEKRDRGFGRHGGERGLRGERGHRDGMRGGMFGLRGIELTDAQKEQIRKIHEANKPSEEVMNELRSIREAHKNGGQVTDAQRARLQELRGQMRSKHDSVRDQVLAVLTPEQRQQLETRNAEMQKRREEFRQKRQELRQQRRTNREATKPTDNN